MPTKRRSRSTVLKTAELGLAAPQVVAHRLTRMALAGPSPSARDNREFTAMVSEKQVAFAQSWVAMSTELARQYQELALSVWSGGFLSKAMAPSHAATRVIAAGIGPIHRKAVSNAKRLAGTRLR